MPRRAAVSAFVFGAVIAVVFMGANREQSASRQTECTAVQHALRDAGKIKVGSSRREVEKLFVLAGGMNFRWHTFYVYPECEYIGIEIDYELNTGTTEFSPEDKVKKVSRLYIDYPARD